MTGEQFRVKRDYFALFAWKVPRDRQKCSDVSMISSKLSSTVPFKTIFIDFLLITF